MADYVSYFDKTIKKTEFLYRFSGINIKSGERKPSDRFKSRCIFIVNFIWVNADLAGAIAWAIDGIKNGKDLLNLTPIAPCIFIAIIGNMKGIFLISNEKHVHKLIHNLREFDRKEKARKLSVEKNLIAEKEFKFLDFVMNAVMISYTALVVTFAISPLAIIAAKYYRDNELVLVLPFLNLYPFDPFQLKAWPFAYVHQLGTEIAVSFIVCAADFFYLSCCTYIRIQFRLLRFEIEHMIPIQGPNLTFIADEEFRARFSEMVNWHQDLIESANLLETIFSKSTLVNFVSSSMVICFTGFNVTMVNDTAFVVPFVCFLILSLTQIFFLCFFADLLMTSSMEISDAVYNSLWFTSETKVAKMLLIMQIRSQVPCMLTASGFADVNLNSFMRILSTSWSYFALLQTIYAN